MNRYLLLIIFTLIVFGCDSKKTLKVDLNNDIVNPKTYVVYKTTNSIIVDGKDDEADWLNTQFSDDFIDIEGFKTPNKKTNVKMLWDHKYLYIFAKLEEDHIWGDIIKRDDVIFHNNDFEIFISPSNNTHNYGEVEINALGTIWDLFLNKPYRLGGKPNSEWDLDSLKSAVSYNGTLNDSSDIDKYWSVELAIPLESYALLKDKPKTIPIDGEQWRINFSRVQWDYELSNGKYSRKKEDGKFLPEYNWVWSSQGEVNMHMPENWGYIQFSDNNNSSKIEFKHKGDVLSEQIIYALFRKIAFKDLKNLKNLNSGTEIYFKPIEINDKKINIKFLKTYSGFNLKANNKNIEYSINENGLLNEIIINKNK